MSRRLFWPAIVSALALLLALGLPPLSGQGRTFATAKSCARCHGSYTKAWKASVHSKATARPLFQAILKQGMEQSPEVVKDMCVMCHAPGAALNKVTDPKSTDYTMGVQCSICHQIESVGMPMGNGSYQVCADGLARGLLLYPRAPHRVKYSALHDEAKLCGSCHQLKNMAGACLQGTGAEWAGSMAGKQGMSCQRCHMRTYVGSAARRAPRRDDLHKHGWPGSTVRAMRQKALKLELKATKEGTQVRAEVKVTNVGAAHSVPSGMGPRYVALQVAVLDAQGQELKSDERRYGRKLMTADGKMAMPWNATKSVSNAIGCGQTREEQFAFKLPAAAQPARVQAKLMYHWAPPEMIKDLQLTGEVDTPALMASALADL